MGRRKDNPSLRDFGYNDNTIRTQKRFSNQLKWKLEIAGTNTPNLLRLLLRLCHVLRAIENKKKKNTLKKEEKTNLKKRLFL